MRARVMAQVRYQLHLSILRKNKYVYCWNVDQNAMGQVTDVSNSSVTCRCNEDIHIEVEFECRELPLH